jgi:flagellar hook-associated protein 1 FlgK
MIDVAIDSSETTLQGLVDAINNHPQNGGRLLAKLSNGKLVLEAQSGRGFAIAQDTSHAMAALGLNAFFSGKDATDISVAPSIAKDPSLIGTALVDLPSGEFSPGDNRAVLRVLELRDSFIPALRGQTFEGLWASRVSAIGVEAAAAYRTSEYQDQVVGQLQDQKSSVSGVNLDEELVKLLEYQWAYQAAARLIQTAREMLDSVMNILE